MKCPNINEYIIGTVDFETRNQKHLYREFGRLLVTDSSFEGINHLSEIVNTLEQKYNDCIQNGLYSKEGENWEGFSETDEFRMKELE